MSLLQIVEIVFDRTLVGARHFVLTERGLGIRLRGGGGFLVSDLARAFDADALEGDAGLRVQSHLGSGGGGETNFYCRNC